MKFKFLTKIVGGLLITTAVACQNQAISKLADSVNSNAPANNANSKNQANTEVPAPRDIKFESTDRVEIVGTFYGSPKADSPGVLLLHGWSSTRKPFDEFAKRLQKLGFNVLAIDGRGFGESVKTTDGKKISPASSNKAVESMKADVGNASDFLAKQKNVNAKKIGIVGSSYGSSLAILYGAENPKVKAVVLLSPGLNYFGSMPTEPAVKKYGDRPLLLVAAKDDKASVNSVRKLKESGANEKYKVKIFPKGGHGTGIFKARVGLEDLLREFLTKSL